MTAIPITSKGRSLCGFVTQTNSVNTNKVRNIGWKDSGVADKMSEIWEKNWGAGARATYTPRIITPPHFEKKQKEVCLAVRDCVSYENNYTEEAFTLTEMSQNLRWVFKNVAENFGLHLFVCPFETFFRHWLPVWQEYGNITILLQQQ